MTEAFFERLERRVNEADSLLCVGLDPRGADLGELRAECIRLIEATAHAAAAFKLNSAFFEVHGSAGVELLRQVIASVPANIPVLLDAKRGDIADTAEAYARAAFDTLGAHAITVSPYLGGDALEPFLRRPERGVFVLCKTSNPGADEFQALETSGRALYEYVAERAQQWNRRSNVGLVVGATDPAAMARARAAAPGLWFLVPGIGAQGGDLQATLAAGLRADGLGLLINVSRALARAADPAVEARRLRDELNAVRRATKLQAASAASAEMRRTLARDLVDSGCVRFGRFTLKSGQESPIYLDLRRLVSHPAVLARVARAYAALLEGLSFDRLAGIPYAGLPIATAVALTSVRPLVYPRREVKEYGTRAAVEGDYAAGETVVVIDDLATTGDTKIESIQKLEAVGLRVRDIVVLIDRQQGAGETLAAAGYRLHAVAALRDLLQEWRASGAITEQQYSEVLHLLGASQTKGQSG